MTIGEAWMDIFCTSLRVIAGSDKYKDKTYEEVVRDAYRLAKYAMRTASAEMSALGAYSDYTGLALTGAQEIQIAADVPGASAYAQPTTVTKAPPKARPGVPTETPAM
jgi:hypothetical protein